MHALNLKKIIRALLASFVVVPFIAAPAQAQLTVIDPPTSCRMRSTLRAPLNRCAIR